MNNKLPYIGLLLFSLMLCYHAPLEAADLTPEQIEQLKKEAEKGQLAKRGGSNGEDKIEKEVRHTTTEKLETERETSSAISAKSPIKKLKSRTEAEFREVRKAFSDFLRESKPLTVSTDIKQFGYDLFAGAPSTFAPATEMPVTSDYVIGPGDEVLIDFYGARQERLVLTVTREGTLPFLEEGPMYVAGLTFSKMVSLIEKTVRQKMIGVTAYVTMGRLRSIKVFVLGDVVRPGSYTVSGLATLSHSLFVSGGIKKIGSLRNIQLLRSGKKIGGLDLYDFLLKGDTSKDVRLLPGDVIFAPPIGDTVGIAGEVTRPAIYELKGKTTVGQLIRLAGGLRPIAYKDLAQIERIDSSGSRVVIDIDLKGEDKNLPVQGGDLLKIFSILDVESKVVFIAGNVKRPGKRAFFEKMKITDIISDNEELLPETYYDYGLIERETGENREPGYIRFNLGKVLAGDRSANLELRPRDKIYIFNRAHFRQAHTVTVDGMVQNPGVYDLKKEMRLIDLILAGGGLLRDANYRKAEMYRTDPMTREITVHHLNLEKLLSGDESENLKLRDLDRVVVHSIWEEKYKQAVIVEGKVKSPGEYIRATDMSVADLIFAAGGITRDTYMEKAQLFRTDWKTKEITLFTINLMKALERDPEHNLPLEDLDRLVVRSIWEYKTKDSVTVSGEVNEPGAYPLATNATIYDLIISGGNFTERAYKKRAELTRFKVVDGEKRESEHMEVDLKKVLERDPQQNMLLRPHDHLTIRPIENWRSTEMATINGEVRFPGTYPIEEGEQLANLIERAGGFTEKAFLYGAKFTRKSVAQYQDERFREMADILERDILRIGATPREVGEQGIDQEKLAISSLKELVAKLRMVKHEGRLVINLMEPDKLRKSEFNLILRDGDAINIPKRPDFVLVMGEVYNSNAFVYNSKLRSDDLLDLAGGFTEVANREGVYVIKANGSVLPTVGAYFRRGIEIGPGDVVVVPEKIERYSKMQLTKDVAKILYELAITAAALNTVGVF